MMGVVGAGFDPTTGAEACESSQGWVLYSATRRLWHANRDYDWEGRPRLGNLKRDDVVVR